MQKIEHDCSSFEAVLDCAMAYACYCYDVKIIHHFKKRTFYTKLYFSVLTDMSVELVHVAVQEYIVTCFIYKLKKKVISHH